MRMDQAQKLIDKYKDRQGYRVHFQLVEDFGYAVADYFPNDLDEPLIPTVEEAWQLAEQFAAATTSNYVNIFVVDNSYLAVDMVDRVIRPWPQPDAKIRTTKPNQEPGA